MAVIAATAHHAALLAAIHEAASLAGAGWHQGAMAEVLAMPGARGWLDTRGGLLLGRGASGEAEILALAVVPEARRRGIARELLARAVDVFGEGTLFLEVDAGNAAALGLYGSAGFEPCGRRPGYYGPGQDALILRRQPRQIDMTVMPSAASATDSTL